MRTILLVLSLAAFLHAADPVAPFWTPPDSAEAVAAANRAELDKARAARDQLLSVKGKRTIANTLAVYDEIRRYVGRAASAGLLDDLSPNKAIRDAATTASQETQKFSTEISLDPRIYQALGALEGIGELRAWQREALGPDRILSALQAPSEPPGQSPR